MLLSSFIHPYLLIILNNSARGGCFDAYDTTTSNGRLIFNIFASLAEFERELISERTRAGLEAARARGRKGGRPFKMTKEKILMASALMADKTSIALHVAKTLGISKSTLYAYINPDGSLKK